MGERRGQSRDASGAVLDWLRSVERVFQEGLEGRLRQIFRAPLQPVEVAKAAAAALERSQIIGLSGPRVANRYEIRLHPSDFERFAAYRIALLRDVEAYLAETARRFNAAPMDGWMVEMIPDRSVRLGQVRVTSSASAAPEGRAPAVGEYTERLSAVRLAAPATRAVLVANGEERHLQTPLTTIGRALDNHIVLDDSRVSRYHAQIQERGGEYRLRDLASTNGTFVGGRRVDDALLAPGDEVSFGGVAMRFERR